MPCSFSRSSSRRLSVRGYLLRTWRAWSEVTVLQLEALTNDPGPAVLGSQDVLLLSTDVGPVPLSYQTRRGSEKKLKSKTAPLAFRSGG